MMEVSWSRVAGRCRWGAGSGRAELAAGSQPLRLPFPPPHAAPLISPAPAFPSLSCFSPQACLIHLLKDLDSYFPVIFCMESGSDVVGNLLPVSSP